MEFHLKFRWEKGRLTSPADFSDREGSGGSVQPGRSLQSLGRPPVTGACVCRAGEVLRPPGRVGGGGGGQGPGLRLHLPGEVQDPGRRLQEHSVLPETHRGRGGPGVAVRAVPGGADHPAGPRHHQQDRELRLEEDQHAGALRGEGGGGGEPGGQAGGLAQSSHLPGRELQPHCREMF